ncbi:unnamed protein product [Pleuronectes platessa]|uniref:Uncharacterized protein n=1 Tax=Pleuronectes platessa TaxID=8262 RepID=A0A9N7YRK6_PLEPL|nr:unnamed protein product [Pleuronectes platessa]
MEACEALALAFITSVPEASSVDRPAPSAASDPHREALKPRELPTLTSENIRSVTQSSATPFRQEAAAEPITWNSGFAPITPVLRLFPLCHTFLLFSSLLQQRAPDRELGRLAGDTVEPWAAVKPDVSLGSWAPLALDGCVHSRDILASIRSSGRKWRRIVHLWPLPAEVTAASLTVEHPQKLAKCLSTMGPVCTLPDRDGKQAQEGRCEQFVLTCGGG